MDPLRGLRVARAIGRVHEVDEALQQQAADHQVGEADHQNPADPACRARPDPPAEQLRDPAVQATKAAADRQEDAEDTRRDDGRGYGQRDVVLRHPHQVADLVLPVLPGREGYGEQDNRADVEGAPGPPAWLARVPVGEGAPYRRYPYRQPVADGRGDPADNALDQAAAREQRRGEGKGREDDRAPAAGERDIEQFAALPLLGRRLGGGRLANFDRVGCKPGRAIWMLAR